MMLCASVDEEVEVDTLKWMIGLVESVSDLPIAVDSPSPRVLSEAYKFCSKPGIINSVSMEGDKIDILFPIVAANPGWEVVALLCDDTGIPQTAEKRLAVFAEIMEKAKQYNIDPSRIHIDPLIEMLCTSEDGISMIVEVISTIRKQYPTIHITAAVSNISFNLPVRKLVNLGFTVLAMNAGPGQRDPGSAEQRHDGSDLCDRSPAWSGRLLHGIHQRLQRGSDRTG